MAFKIKQDYVNAVNAFNKVGCFQIVLPSEKLLQEHVREAIYEQFAARSMDTIVYSAARLLDEYEAYRKLHNKYPDIKAVNDICMLVVHLNQISNGVKGVDEPMTTFEEPEEEEE
jgi:hypothetical protein